MKRIVGANIAHSYNFCITIANEHQGYSPFIAGRRRKSFLSSNKAAYLELTFTKL
jgi:hypothetical protein